MEVERQRDRKREKKENPQNTSKVAKQLAMREDNVWGKRSPSEWGKKN